jgi:hypothetical protein
MRTTGKQAQQLFGTALGESIPMSRTRRDFIKYVVAGSIASGCPIDQALLAEPGGAAPGPKVEGEHFAVCHQLRDGHSFPKPDATKKADVVIVGGGVAGLSAAYFLKGKDWLLLEKEDHFGGNAYQEEYEGQIFATEAAYGYRGDQGDHLAKEIGLNTILKRTKGADSSLGKVSCAAMLVTDVRSNAKHNKIFLFIATC